MGLAAAQGAKQGGAIGLLSSLVRQAGQKAALLVISSTASTTIAAGMLDGGQALYAYSRGQIDEAELGREVMAGFLKDYDACLSESRDYHRAVQAILGFTDSMSYSLQHREFQEFQKQMQGEEEWVLK
jgi:C-terminal processing protease CtpA/Prc